jgi:hypothetical protein
MLGGKELAQLDLQKQALLLESGLNRVALLAQIQSLRSATAWVSEAASLSRELMPLLVVLAPIAGFLLTRRRQRPSSWLSRAITLAKWIGPLCRVWKSFASQRAGAERSEPAA